MINLFKKVTAAVSAVALLVAWFGIAPKAVYANPSYNAPTVQTATATSSPVFMTPGTATSTLTYDSQANPTTNRFKADSMAVGVRFAASSTAAILTITPEYSTDGIDWYRSFVVDGNSYGTTTPAFNALLQNTITWKFASSTVGGVAQTNANSATSTALFMMPTPTRFVRLVFSVTGANTALWAQMIPIKQQ